MSRWITGTRWDNPEQTERAVTVPRLGFWNHSSLPPVAPSDPAVTTNSGLHAAQVNRDLSGSFALEVSVTPLGTLFAKTLFPLFIYGITHC